jgi:hypothetical protein
MSLVWLTPHCPCVGRGDVRDDGEAGTRQCAVSLISSQTARTCHASSIAAYLPHSSSCAVLLGDFKSFRYDTHIGSRRSDVGEEIHTLERSH